MDRVLLGQGTLTWSANERRSDRYGSVYLIPDGRNSLCHAPSRSLVKEDVAHTLTGRYGEIVAVVLQARESTHIGDLFHGLFPEKPEVGEIIPLGTGRFFWERAPEGGVQIGVSPDAGDHRPKGWWLDAPRLYRAHEQTVQLFFGGK